MLAIFGASGDLTRRKIFPALYALAYRKLLPEQFGVLGSARSEQYDRRVRRLDGGGRAGVRPRRVQSRRRLGRLASVTRYVSTDFADESGEDHVAQTLTEMDEELGTRGNRLYYLAVPPEAMPVLVAGARREARRRAAGFAADRREAVRATTCHSARELNELLDPATSPRTRSSGSITTSARTRCRTCLRCGSRTGSSSRSGTGSSSTMSRSPSPSRSASSGRAAFYDRSGRDPRHLSEPPAPARCADGDGAADRLPPPRRSGTRRSRC